jgi:hypothetical protein
VSHMHVCENASALEICRLAYTSFEGLPRRLNALTLLKLEIHINKVLNAVSSSLKKNEVSITSANPCCYGIIAVSFEKRTSRWYVWQSLSGEGIRRRSHS